jgi:Kdo2-lipid IVA lauroyltransferase/acyltransferase
MNFLIYPLFWFFSILPFKILYVLSDFLYLIIYYIVAYRKKVVRKNLKNSFPDKSFKEIRSIERKFYHYFCDLLLETLKELTLTEVQFQKRVEYLNTDRILELLKEQKSIIIMTAHYGNWEWASYFPKLFEGTDFKSYQIYKQLRNSKTDKIVYDLRSKFGGVNIEKHQLLRRIVSNVNEKKHGVYWMIADQIPSGKNMGLRLNFLHQSTAALTGSEQLSHKFGFPVFYARITRPYRGKYSFDFIPVCEKPEEAEKNEITSVYFKLLEESIVERPELWLWSHKRWKR